MHTKDALGEVATSFNRMVSNLQKLVRQVEENAGQVAAAVSFIEHKEYVPDLVASWLQGYRKVRSISKEEESEIPTFIMLRRLLLLAWLGTRHDSDTAKEFGTEFTEKTAELAEKYLLTFA